MTASSAFLKSATNAVSFTPANAAGTSLSKKVRLPSIWSMAISV
ncbi:MAG TPA: hypothetical protein VHT50_28680 [Mycobacterium sp.]|nr:hypothetical protein [Mycobacterium sp.]